MSRTIVLVQPDASRRASRAEGLRGAGFEVQELASLAGYTSPPKAEVALIAGQDLAEDCALYRRTRMARWVLAEAPDSLLSAALEAGAHDCVREDVGLDEILLRIQVAVSQGWLAPPLGELEPDADPLDGMVPRLDGRQLRAILDLLPLPTGILDSKGCFVQCNRALEQAFRLPPGRLLGRSLERLFSVDPMTALYTELIRRGELRDLELHPVDREGNRYTVAGQARWIPHGEGFVIGSFADVTARKLTEEALRRSEASLRSVLHASPDGIIVHAGDRYLFVNPAAVRQLGFTDPEQLMRTRIWERLHPDDIPSVRERITRMSATDEPASVRDIRFLKSDGDVFVGEVASIPATFDGIPAIISIIRDVGEQRRLQSQLFLADRLATVGTLAVGVAHEINNPLSWVMGNLGLLADEFDRQVVLREQDVDPTAVVRSRARVRELLGRAQEGTERVRRIVRDLGRFARSDGAGDGLIDIHALLDSTLEIADVQIRHRARLVREYRARRRVQGNEGRLGQVFLNLLVNAGQAIAPGNPLDNEIRVTTRELDEGRIEVAISDTGHGIPAKIRARIFDPFFTTKPVGEGTGIGLAISHSIVSAAGGTMSVESEEGKGTTFRVALPALEHEEQSALNRLPTIEETVQPKPVRKARVLVVDDEPLIREMVCDALVEHEVEAVATGRAALERIGAADWDLILCDLIMPELSGMDLWERLAEVKPKARNHVVFMTGGDFSGKASEFMATVTVRRLEKPFSIKTLRQLVRRAVSR